MNEIESKDDPIEVQRTTKQQIKFQLLAPAALYQLALKTCEQTE